MDNDNDLLGEIYFNDSYGGLPNWMQSDPLDKRQKRSTIEALLDPLTIRAAQASLDEDEKPELSPLQVRVNRAVELHAPAIDPRDTNKSYCTYCSSQYPCETVRILTDKE